jgi:hypothetical protein
MTRFIPLLFALSASLLLSAQSGEANAKAWFKDRLYTGGGVGLGFSSLGGNVQIAPLVGLKLNNRLHTGMRGTYWYHWGRVQDQGGLIHRYGGSIGALSLFGRLFVTENIFLHTEPEWMTLPTYTWQNDNNGSAYILKERRVSAFNFYVGGGYFQGTGGSSGIFIMLLYNLNQNPNALYANPMIQMGFSFGL